MLLNNLVDFTLYLVKLYIVIFPDLNMKKLSYIYFVHNVLVKDV